MKLLSRQCLEVSLYSALLACVLAAMAAYYGNPDLGIRVFWFSQFIAMLFVLSRCPGWVSEVQPYISQVRQVAQNGRTATFAAIAPLRPRQRPQQRQAKPVQPQTRQAQQPAAANPLLNQIIAEARAIHDELRRLNIDASINPRRCTPGGNQLAFYGIDLQGKTKAADIARVLLELSRAVSQARRTRVTLRFDEITLRLEAEHPLKQPLHWTPRRMEMTKPHAMTLGVSHHNGAQLTTANFADAPHILVAGETGSGKSVLLRNLVTSLAYATSPDELRIAIVDLKNEDMIPFQRLPHVIAFAGDRGAAVDVIGMIQAEKTARIADPNRKPHRLLLIIDELAQLAPVKGALDNLGDIMSVGRSKSINVIAATQSPTEDGGMGGMMKANIPLRLIGAVSAGQSYTATRRKGAGADMLPGKGSFLYIAGPQMYRFQTFMMDNGDVGRAVSAIRERWVGRKVEPHEPVQTPTEVFQVYDKFEPVHEPQLNRFEPVHERIKCQSEPVQNFVVAPTMTPFPLTEKRPLTPTEAAEVRRLADTRMSKSALCHHVYGAKSGRYMQWISEAFGNGENTNVRQ